MDSFDIVLKDGARYVCTLITEQPAPPATLVPYSQRDPRWANEVYSTGSTFAKNGCLVVCVAMVVSAAYPDRILPPEVAENLKRAGCFVGDYLSRPSRIPDAYPRLSWDGVIHWRDKPADMAFVRSELAQYGCAVAEVAFNPQYPVYWVDANKVTHWNQHFIVITELTADGDVLIADPWDGDFKLLGASRYSLPGWTASRALTGLRLVRPNVQA